MGLIDRIRHLFAAPETKRSATAPVIALHQTGRPQWTPRNYASLAAEGFVGNPVGYRCVRMIAEAAASIPWLLFEGSQERETHPLLSLLRRPNPAMAGRELMESFYGYLQVAGNAYLERVAIDGEPRELHALRPDRMRAIAGASGWPEAYEYSVNGSSVRFDQEQAASPILHLRLFNPLDDYYGLSPLEAAARPIDIHNAAGAWNKAVLDNAARPSGALIYKAAHGAGALTVEQFSRLKDELESTFQGSGNAGRPMLLGIPGDNTFANYAEANRTFWRQTVLPLATRTAEALTNWLAPDFGKDLRLALDTDAIEALSVEREALWARIGAAQFITADEKRAAVGYAPLKSERGGG